MQPEGLEKFLREKIPLTNALGIRVRHAGDDRAEIFAPLKPNLNHFGTAFGGSLQAVLVLSCYSWLFRALEKRSLSSHVVLKSSRIQYFKPVKQDFTAICRAPEQKESDRFFKTMERKGRAQIVLRASVEIGGVCACELEGDFVAVPTRTSAG